MSIYMINEEYWESNYSSRDEQYDRILAEDYGYFTDEARAQRLADELTALIYAKYTKHTDAINAENREIELAWDAKIVSVTEQNRRNEYLAQGGFTVEPVPVPTVPKYRPIPSFEEWSTRTGESVYTVVEIPEGTLLSERKVG